MAFTINRLLVRMIKASRDFSFVDKIGELTTTLINTIPETELQRNGQYGALVIINNKYKFQAQITKTENNVDTILSDELASESFKEKLSIILDVDQKLITTIKKTLDCANNLKSIICQIEGSITENSIEPLQIFLKEYYQNPFSENKSDLRQFSYIWREESYEKCIMVSKTDDGEDYRYIFAIQDFSRKDMSFNQVRDVINKTLVDINTNLISIIGKK